MDVRSNGSVCLCSRLSLVTPIPTVYITAECTLKEIKVHLIALSFLSTYKVKVMWIKLLRMLSLTDSGEETYYIS